MLGKSGGQLKKQPRTPQTTDSPQYVKQTRPVFIVHVNWRKTKSDQTTGGPHAELQSCVLEAVAVAASWEALARVEGCTVTALRAEASPPLHGGTDRSGATDRQVWCHRQTGLVPQTDRSDATDRQVWCHSGCADASTAIGRLR
ncbi:hypothetical protein NHX12_019380 [Muraenolepis orangiensis]|uniref:Uncharacterized protein n=1 Tax=Muraenolepis orangiensis TaxID=630683 RepID=A0A9Q0EX97_9TELE|nr:hypothetical protein NHX12_019380 [Muraenolepis orangiensis]